MSDIAAMCANPDGNRRPNLLPEFSYQTNTANSADCKCGTAISNNVNGMYCIKLYTGLMGYQYLPPSYLVSDIAKCANTDGTAANSVNCQCGTAISNANNGRYCIELEDLVSDVATCLNTDGTAENQDDCICWSKILDPYDQYRITKSNADNRYCWTSKYDYALVSNSQSDIKGCTDSSSSNFNFDANDFDLDACHYCDVSNAPLLSSQYCEKIGNEYYKKDLTLCGVNTKQKLGTATVSKDRVCEACPSGQYQLSDKYTGTSCTVTVDVTGCMNSTALNYYDTCKELPSMALWTWNMNYEAEKIRWKCQDANVHDETTCVYACACKDDPDCQDYTTQEKQFLKGTGGYIYKNTICYGCKELDEANNYDEYADEDDGTCEVTNYRCIDSHANNYDEDSTAEPLLVDPDGDYSKCTYDICPAGMYQDSGGCKKCADGTVSAKGSTECAVECPAGTERLDIDYHNNAAMYNRNSHMMNIGWTIYHVPSRYERACLSCADGKVSAVNADGPSINAFSLNHDVYKGLVPEINTTSDEITCSLDDCPSSTYKHGTQCLAECPEGTSVNGDGTVCTSCSEEEQNWLSGGCDCRGDNAKSPEWCTEQKGIWVDKGCNSQCSSNEYHTFEMNIAIN